MLLALEEGKCTYLTRIGLPAATTYADQLAKATTPATTTNASIPLHTDHLVSSYTDDTKETETDTTDKQSIQRAMAEQPSATYVLSKSKEEKDID